MISLGYHSSITVLRFPLPQSGRLSMNLTCCLGDVKEIFSLLKKPSFSPRSIAVFDKSFTPRDCQVLCYGAGMVSPAFTLL